MSAEEIVGAVQDSLNSYSSGIPEIERNAFDTIATSLKDLSLDNSGNIKKSVGNLRLIGKVRSKIQKELISDKYLQKVSNLKNALDSITLLQSQYFSEVFAGFSKPKIVEELKKVSLDAMQNTLIGAGVENDVIGAASDIVRTHILEGSSFAQMNDKMKDFLVGTEKQNGKLLSYSKQIVNDSLSTYARNYNKLVTSDLGLEWFQYAGAIVKDSRPLCKYLLENKRFIHKSELASIAQGKPDGKISYEGKKMTLGMMPGTNASNFQERCGGFNCEHQLIPVSENSVPKETRIRVYKKLGIAFDEKGFRIAA